VEIKLIKPCKIGIIQTWGYDLSFIIIHNDGFHDGFHRNFVEKIRVSPRNPGGKNRKHDGLQGKPSQNGSID